MKKAKLLWVDLEFTGLDPDQNKILEVGAIATDMELNEIARYRAVVKVDDDFLRERLSAPFWTAHPETRDALIAQNQNGRPVAEVEQELIAFVDKYFGRTIYLAGNSIHQDRKFIEREMPTLDTKLHYRMLDVTAWKIYFENALGRRFTKPENHRAEEDILGSIEEFRWYLTFLK